MNQEIRLLKNTGHMIVHMHISFCHCHERRRGAAIQTPAAKVKVNTVDCREIFPTPSDLENPSTILQSLHVSARNRPLPLP